MAQLAIKGHKTRGKEVIEILEMLGGENEEGLLGDNPNVAYYISDNKTILCDWSINSYTLEEFFEKFPYKVGDKVLYHDSKAYIKSMKWGSREIIYTVEWEKELWETTVFYLQPYKEETMEEKLCIGLFPVSNGRKEIIPCNGYEVVSDGGKFYVVKKLPQYPKTYVECCEILYPNENFQTVAQPIKGHHGKKLFAFQKLLVCRDAYWKIIGEQMGLDKPWAPVYTDDNIKYSITTHKNRLDFNGTIERNYVLIFPTKEIKNAFYKNFKELIEKCKELL